MTIRNIAIMIICLCSVIGIVLCLKCIKNKPWKWVTAALLAAAIIVALLNLRF